MFFFFCPIEERLSNTWCVHFIHLQTPFSCEASVLEMSCEWLNVFGLCASNGVTSCAMTAGAEWFQPAQCGEHLAIIWAIRTQEGEHHVFVFWGEGGLKEKKKCQRGPPKPWESVSHCCHLVCNSKETIFWSSTKRIEIYTYICTGTALVVLHFGIILVIIIDKLLFMICMHVVACVSFIYLKSPNISKVKSSQS